MNRSALELVLAATTLLAAGGAAPAAAAGPQLLGQTGAPGVGGSCGHCSVVQFADAGPASSTYVVPSSGVLTKVRVYVGNEINAGDWFQARTFRTAGAPNATVISEGAQHSLAGSPPGTARTFFDRLPAAAGDRLGGRFHVANTPNATPVEFPTASASDVAGVLYPPADPAVGGSFAVTPATHYRVNMLATLESDVDGDGYGDTSQDLCPGDAAAIVACSGTLFGSRLQGEYTTSGGSCGYACVRVQKTVAGASTAAPVDGVVVRWRVLAAPAGSYRVRVVAPAGGTMYTVLRSSAAQTVTADPSALKQAISIFATRLPIPAGGYVGLAPPPFVAQRFASAAPGSTYAQLNDGADGTVIPETATVAGEVLYDADIEPDADHDGYGDATQDGCPTDTATQAACPAVAPAEPGSPGSAGQPGTGTGPAGGTRPQATTPAISGLRAVYKRFRVKRDGAVIARRRPHAGTTLRLRLSEVAAVTFSFALKRPVACPPVRKNQRCTRWVFVHAFKRDLAAGPSSVAYSGRYRRDGKTRSLEPGTYRMSVVAINAAGTASRTRRIALTVRPGTARSPRSPG